LPFNTLNNNNGAFNGNAGLVWLPASDWKIDGLFSTGFRSPNVDDVGKVFEFTENDIVIPNADLRPEYIYNVEMSIHKKISDWLEINLTGFYAHLTNAIVRRQVTFNSQDSIFLNNSWKDIQANVNAGAAFVRGMSGSIKGSITPQLSFQSTLNYNQGKDLERNEPLRHVAPLFGQLSLHYKIKKFEAEALLQYNGPVAWEELAPSERAKTHLYTPEGSLAWQTVNFRTAYHLNTHISINASLENITDTHYRPYSSGISAPGRNFIISVAGNF
jgi:hemoglobin/transferrin/lactoferrin receptor protein